MNRLWIGPLCGAVAGVLDVIPMVIQGLTWDANLGAFSMWAITGFFISRVDLKIHPVVKGIFISILILTPSAFLIGWHEPLTLIPILGMTIVLGGLLGFGIHKIQSR